MRRHLFGNGRTGRRRLLFTIAITAMSVLGVFGVVTTQASASTVTSVTSTLVNDHTIFCLDGNSAGVVYSLKCNDGDYQKWIIRHYQPSNFYTLQSVKTKGCLYTFPVRANYMGVRTAPCNPTATEQLF